MKIQKSILKKLIKECLVEILVEGLDNSSSQPLKESLIKKQYQTIPHVQQQEQDNHIKNIAACATRDPMLQEMLAHTAQTTYGEQIGAEMPTMDSLRMSEQMNIDVSNVVVEQTPQNAIWAALAFDTPKSKK
jgi:hypothetical protein